MDATERFAYLLKPIRELSDNWNIDIASELEDYLEELDNVSFAFKDGEEDGKERELIPMSFAEAAMLIQGSACVYSRKVEYLYNLVYQTLNVLFAKKKAKVEKEIVEQTQQSLYDQLDFEELESLDNIEVSKNINLPLEQVIEKKFPKNNVKDILDIKIDEEMMKLARDNYITKKGNFKSYLSYATTLTSGLVVLGCADRAAHTHTEQLPSLSSTEVFATPLPKKKRVSLRGVSATPRSEEEVFFVNAENSPTSPNAPSTLPETSQSISSFGEGGFSLRVSAGEDPETSFLRTPSVRCAAPAGACWPTLDPYGAATETDTPFRRALLKSVRGKITSKQRKTKEEIEYFAGIRRPKIIEELEAEPNGGQEAFLPLHSHSLLHDYQNLFSRQEVRILEDHLKGLALKKPIFREFDNQCEEEIKRRINEKRRLGKFLIKGNQQNDGLTQQERDEFLYDNLNINDENDEIVETKAEEEGEGTIGENESILSTLTPIAPISRSEERKLNEDTMQDEQTLMNLDTEKNYEDLVREKVEQIHRTVTNVSAEASLHQRVEEWHEHLEDVMKEQESHETFDIMESSKEVIESLEKVEESGKMVEGKVNFGDLVQSREKWEVARKFLASLQLLNTGHLRLFYSSPTSLQVSRGENTSKIEIDTSTKNFLDTSDSESSSESESESESESDSNSESESESVSELDSNNSSNELNKTKQVEKKKYSKKEKNRPSKQIRVNSNNLNTSKKIKTKPKEKENYAELKKAHKVIKAKDNSTVSRDSISTTNSEFTKRRKSEERNTRIDNFENKRKSQENRNKSLVSEFPEIKRKSKSSDRKSSASTNDFPEVKRKSSTKESRDTITDNQETKQKIDSNKQRKSAGTEGFPEVKRKSKPEEPKTTENTPDATPKKSKEKVPTKSTPKESAKKGRKKGRKQSKKQPK